MASNWAGYEKAVKEDPQGVATVLYKTLRVIRSSDGRDKMSPSLELELAKIIENESDWRPEIQNYVIRKDGTKVPFATGLIQFIPSTAVMLGTTPDALKKMSRTEQADYVAAYFKRIQDETGPVRRPGDLYVLTFYPSALGTDDSHVIAKPGSVVWEQNPGLRINGNGPITTGKVRSLVIPQTSPPTPFPEYNTGEGSKSSGSAGLIGIIVTSLVLWAIANAR